MIVPRAVHVATLVTAMLALAAFALSHEAFVFLAFSLAAAAASAVVAQGPRAKRLPTIVAHLLIGAIVLASGLSAFLTGSPLDVEGVGLACAWALLVKLCARHRASDERHVMVLSCLLLFVAALEGDDLLSGLPLVVASLLVPIGFAAVWTQSQHERAAAARAGATPPKQVAPHVEAQLGATPLRSWAVFAFGSIALTMVAAPMLFVAFPRRSWADERWAHGRQSGFSMHVSLADRSNIESARTEVLTMRWIGPDGSARKHDRPLLLRGAVFDRYDPRSQAWQMAEQSQRRPFAGAGEAWVDFSDGAVDQKQQVFRQIVQMRGLAVNQLFSVMAPIAVQAPMGSSVSLEAGTLLVTETGSRIGEFDRYAFLVKPYATDRDVVALERTRPPIGPMPTCSVDGVRTIAERIWESRGPVATRVPTAAEAARDPADRWLRNRRMAEAFRAELLSGAYAYTTDLRRLTKRRGEDPIMTFLTRDRQGHCEYFASALCALCQSVGVDARLVAGFIAVEYDTAQSQYIVRSSNAHAWVEVRTGDALWTPFDGTPEDTLVAMQEAQRSWADALRWLWDPLNFAWTRHVASFDRGAQEDLARSLDGTRDAIARPVAWIRDALISARNQLAETFSGAVGLVWLISLASVLAASGAIVALLRVGRARVARVVSAHAPRRERRVARLYLDGLALADRLGATRAPGMTPMQVVERLEQRSPQAARHLRELINAWYAVRFGGAPLTRAAEERAQHALHSMRRERTRSRKPRRMGPCPRTDPERPSGNDR